MQTQTAVQASPDARESSSDSKGTHYELRFRSLFDQGRGLSFLCDAAGVVNMDAMSPRCRQNYLFARAMVGREYACPVVVRSYVQ